MNQSFLLGNIVVESILDSGNSFVQYKNILVLSNLFTLF